MFTNWYGKFMQNRSSKRRPRDLNQVAALIGEGANQEMPAQEQPPQLPEEETKGKNPAAVALGRLGGMKGGKARAAKLSQEQRKEIARKAAQARWSKRG